MSTIVETDVDVKGEAYFQLENRIKSKTARFGVIGLGYVGLPLALTLSEAGFDVTGIDIDTNRVDAIAAGRSYITTSQMRNCRRPHAKNGCARPPIYRSSGILTPSVSACRRLCGKRKTPICRM